MQCEVKESVLTLIEDEYVGKGYTYLAIVYRAALLKKRIDVCHLKLSLIYLIFHDEAAFKYYSIN